MLSAGWIIIPRELRNHWIWRQPKKLQMWLDLVMLAAWEKSKTIIGNNTYVVQRGQYVTTTRNLMYIWHCCSQTATEFLKMLEENDLIKREKLPKASIITIKNYDVYQPSSVTLSSTKTTTKVEQKEKINNNISSSFLNVHARKKNSNFLEELLKDEIYLESAVKNFQIRIEDVRMIAEKFNIEKTGLGETHENYPRYREHFNNYLRIHVNKEIRRTNSGKNGNQPKESKRSDSVDYKPDDYNSSF